MDVTVNKVIEYIKSKGRVTATELSDYLGISRQAIHRRLINLSNEGLIYKIGKPPKVFYLLNENDDKGNVTKINHELKNVIDENFFIITPSGEKMEGFDGFEYWCRRNKLPVEKTAYEYNETIKKYSLYKKEGFIDGMYKIRHTFDQVFLDKVFYIDFYSIERFGKTKLGQMLLYAKQSQDRILIKGLVNKVRSSIKIIINKFDVDAIGYIPPTVKRETQLMKEIERQLDTNIPTFDLVKVKTSVIVPQKTLNKLEDRVENAEKTIYIDSVKKYKTVLLIDDALGSGATLNEVARKIKEQKLADVVIGLAIVGSFSGFEVISEV